MNYEYLIVKISLKSTDTPELRVLTLSVVKQPDIIRPEGQHDDWEQ